MDFESKHELRKHNKKDPLTSMKSIRRGDSDMMNFQFVSIANNLSAVEQLNLEQTFRLQILSRKHFGPSQNRQNGQPCTTQKTTETATCKNTSIAVSGVCAKNLGDIIWGAQKSPPRPPRIFNLGEYTGEKPAREGPEARYSLYLANN